MTQTIQHLRKEFNQEIETLKKTKAEIKMELKCPMTRKFKEYLRNRTNQAKENIRTHAG